MATHLFKTASDWVLQATAGGAPAWAAELKRLLVFQSDWESALADVGVNTRVSARAIKIHGDTALIEVNSAATRSRLQFLGPELLSYLQTCGWQLKAIEYHIQASLSFTEEKSVKHKTSDSLQASTHIVPEDFKKALSQLRSQASIVKALSKNKQK